MSYCVRPGRPFGPELQRIAIELMDEATELLRDDPRAVEIRVHEVRKRCKMLRALFRLLGMPEQNRVFRDVARELSGTRDAVVVFETFEQIAPPGEYDDLRARLRDRAEQTVGDLEAASARVEAVVRAARADAVGWSADWEFETILDPCVEFYRRGRKLLRAARKDPSPDALHEWRKRVKDHWYHMRLLAKVCPTVAKPRRSRLDELQDQIGWANDLVILREAVAEPALLARIDDRRAALVRDAFAGGGELYKAKPKEFADSLRTSYLR